MSLLLYMDHLDEPSRHATIEEATAAAEASGLEHVTVEQRYSLWVVRSRGRWAGTIYRAGGQHSMRLRDPRP